MWCIIKHRTLLGKAERRKVSRLSAPLQRRKERWGQVQQPVVQQSRDRWVRRWKRPTAPLYLDELPGWKLQIQSQIEVPVSYLERYSPKGSCHPVESDMSHTLAQICLTDLWCGTHRACRKHSIKSWSKRKEGIETGSWPFPFKCQINATNCRINHQYSQNKFTTVLSIGSWPFPLKFQEDGE